MGLLAGDSISPSDFITLKEKIKNIMLNKRVYYGSLVEYGGEEYDYENDPTTNGIIYAEHQNKIVIPMRAITTNNVDAIAEKNDKIISLQNISTIIDAFDAKKATSSVKDCQNYCSGLCVTQCSTGCTGCSNDCAKNCGSNCSGGCEGCDGCSGCGGACSSGCTSDCGGSCRGCTHSCTGGCTSDNCTNGCFTNCYSTCYGKAVTV